MTQVAKLPVVIEISKLPQGVLNAPDTEVKVKFLSLNMETRDCVVKLEYKGATGTKWMNVVTSARLTVNVMKWFSNERPVLDEEGKYTGQSMTNFQRYLIKRDIPIDTKLGDLVFESVNHSEDYAVNPFSLRFNKKYDVCTIELVNMPFKKPIIKTNPMTGTNEIVRYIYPMRTDGKGIIKLRKESYKRVIVR